MRPAACFECQIYGALKAVNQRCQHSMPNPMYPSISKFKIPDDFEKIEEKQKVTATCGH